MKVGGAKVDDSGKDIKYREIWQYTPTFIEREVQRMGRFTSVDEMLEIPFVKRWTESGGFLRFGLYQELLLAYFESGMKLVVGSIRPHEGFALEDKSPVV